MRTLARVTATAVAALAATTAMAVPAAATEAPAVGAAGCVTTYIDGRQPYYFTLDPKGLIADTIQVGGIPGPITVNPAPALNTVVGITAYIVLNEAGQLIALVNCIV